MGRKRQRRRDADRFAHDVLEVLEVAAAGDVVAAVDRLRVVAPGPAEIWRLCCALGAVIAGAAHLAQPDGTGPLTATVELQPGMPAPPPAEREAVERAAAFIAAAGNDDWDGAHRIFVIAGHADDDARLFVHTLLRIAVAVTREALHGS